MITGKAKLAGVIGWPVAHSLSPLLHNHWLERLGIDGAYLPLAVEPGNLETVVRTLPKMGFAGCNLTIPHKEAALKIVDTCSSVAQRLGAVNTIIVGEGGRLHGDNTDGIGFITNIKKQIELTPHHKRKAVVLGAGGAARAICAALQDESFQDVVVVNRTQEKAEALVRDLGGVLRAAKWEEAGPEMKGAGLLINTTSLGMSGKEPLLLSCDTLPIDALVTDIVYTPLYTELLKWAQSRGNPVVTGIGMLIEQAVPGFTAWFGQKPSVDSLCEALLLKEAGEI